MTVDEGTQQNAALVEEIAAASRSLEEQATSLLELVSAHASGAKKASADPAPVDALTVQRARRAAQAA
jgi:hypothetical protein